MALQLRVPGRIWHSGSWSPRRLSPVSAIRSSAAGPSISPSSCSKSVPTSYHCRNIVTRDFSPITKNSCAAAMSTMQASHGHSEACCNIPPVVSTEYAPKGSYQQIGGLKTYVTGPADASKGIISIMDIFGFFDQTIQGADILATSDQHQRYRVFIPDIVKANPVPIEWFPPNTEEKQKKVGEWFGRHSPQSVAAELPEYVKAVQGANPSIKSWGIIGYCWGGKIVELVTSSNSNLFKIAATPHPAMIDPAGAEKISIPYALLASGDEDPDTVKEFERRLNVPHHVETFGDQIHGFMAARANLSDPRVKKEYARGYKTVLNFFAKHWP